MNVLTSFLFRLENDGAVENEHGNGQCDISKHRDTEDTEFASRLSSVASVSLCFKFTAMERDSRNFPTISLHTFQVALALSVLFDQAIQMFCRESVKSASFT